VFEEDVLRMTIGPQREKVENSIRRDLAITASYQTLVG
jgi:hypothetical protein